MIIYESYVGYDHYWIVLFHGQYAVKRHNGVKTDVVFRGAYETCKKYIDDLYTEYQIETMF